jgi:hypothetical protein
MSCCPERSALDADTDLPGVAASARDDSTIRGTAESSRVVGQAVAPHLGHSSRLNVQSRPQEEPRAQTSHLGLLCSVIAGSPQRSNQVPLPARRKRSPSLSIRRNEPLNSTTVLMAETIQPHGPGWAGRRSGVGIVPRIRGSGPGAAVVSARPANGTTGPLTVVPPPPVGGGATFYSARVGDPGELPARSFRGAVRDL